MKTFNSPISGVAGRYLQYFSVSHSLILNIPTHGATGITDLGPKIHCSIPSQPRCLQPHCHIVSETRSTFFLSEFCFRTLAIHDFPPYMCHIHTKQLAKLLYLYTGCGRSQLTFTLTMNAKMRPRLR
jgi:hypothetical protein